MYLANIRVIDYVSAWPLYSHLVETPVYLQYRLAGVSRLFLILEIYLARSPCFQHKSSFTTGVISSVDLSVQAANALHYPTRGLYRLLDLGGKKDCRAGG